MEPSASPCSSLKRGWEERGPICKLLTMELYFLLYANMINDLPIYDLFTLAQHFCAYRQAIVYMFWMYAQTEYIAHLIVHI